jgi:hypothetical protein
MVSETATIEQLSFGHGKASFLETCFGENVCL